MQTTTYTAAARGEIMDERRKVSVEFEPPGPGSWELDASHQERPLSRYLREFMLAEFSAAFREAFAAYGVGLTEVELAEVNGFLYACPRPIGAPKGATGHPPMPIVWLASRLHPELRRRNKRAAEVWRDKTWRAEIERLQGEELPEAKKQYRALENVETAELTGDALIGHLEACYRAGRESTFRHHRVVTACMVPVGDFLAHTVAWTARPAAEILHLMRGSSPGSRGAEAELGHLASLIRDDDSARAQLDWHTSPEDVIGWLRETNGELGAAARAWLGEVGLRITTGFDVADKTALEVPAVLVSPLRSAVAGKSSSDTKPKGGTTLEDVRAEVPEDQRAFFDELLEEARHVYRIRDERALLNEVWTYALCRRALLVAGRILAEKGELLRPDHVFDLTHHEVISMLRGEEGPSAAETAAIVELRETLTTDDAPFQLGPAPGAPPPPEWLPAPSARMARAMLTYIEAMFLDCQEESKGAEVKGLAGAPGTYVGTARIVRGADDFGRVEEGDVLVARMTSPAYNVLLPILGAVVTDRGGLLSHPAIVAREFGIPAVVGSKVATQTIPDGARVEVDGSNGVVRILP